MNDCDFCYMRVLCLILDLSWKSARNKLHQQCIQRTECFKHDTILTFIVFLKINLFLVRVLINQF